MRLPPTIFFFLIAAPFSLMMSLMSLTSTASAQGPIVPIVPLVPIVITPTVTPITAQTYNESTQLIYNGVITATATGGEAPYTYTLTEPTYTTLPQNNPYFPWLGPGAYSLLVTDASGQTARIPMTVSFVYPQPAMTVSSIVQPSLCGTSDGSFTLNASGGTPPYNYSIDGGNTWSATNTFNNLCGGVYYALLRDSKGQLFIIGDNPTAPQGGVVNLAAPSCTIHTGVGVVATACANTGGMVITVYSNSPPIKFSLDGVNFFTLPPNPFFPGVYQYDSATGLAPGTYNTVTRDATGSVALFSVSIEKYCFPHLALNVSAASCGHNDGAIGITPSYSTPPYSYTLDGLHYLGSPGFSGLAPGNYNLLAMDGNGQTDNLTVFVGGLCPGVTATTTPETCANGDGSITATGASGFPPYQYSIDGSAFQSGFVFPGLHSGSHTLTIMDINGGKGTTTVIVPNQCLAFTSTVTNSACDNHSGIIHASPGPGGTPPYTYSIDGINFQSSNSFGGLAAGNYTVTIKDLASVKGTATATVAIDTNLTVDAGSDLLYCAGISHVLGATSNGSGFSWSPATGLDNPAALDPHASPPVTTEYFLTATLGVCSHTDSITVTINPAPIADAGRDTSICSGQSVQLNGGSSANASPSGGSSSGSGASSGSASGALSYKWTPSTGLDNPGAADPDVASPPATIIYRLVVTDANGCSSLDDAQVTITVTPTPKVFAGNDTAILSGQPIRLHVIDVNHSGFSTYSWSPSNGLSDPSAGNPVATPLQTTTYKVLASTPDGCQGSGSVTLKTYSNIGIFVPNAFTPNGDGHNDILRAIPLGLSTFRNFSIYSRSGQRIFFTANPSEGWDGSFNGRPQTTGVYIWVASGIDLNGHPVENTGAVTLIR